MFFLVDSSKIQSCDNFLCKKFISISNTGYTIILLLKKTFLEFFVSMVVGSFVFVILRCVVGVMLSSNEYLVSLWKLRFCRRCLFEVDRVKNNALLPLPIIPHNRVCMLQQASLIKLLHKSVVAASRSARLLPPQKTAVC